MFRLLHSGLPPDPVFPADMEGLGYFINKDDEIRSIENPRAYFKYFLTRNDYYNDKQREAMNVVIRGIIYERLGDLGLERVCLPLGTPECEPHIPIYVSSDLSQKKSVIILFYEHNQDLGVFAIRIVGGRGGINQGSAVNLVKYIQSLGSSEAESPGIILANLGQLRWWRRGKKAVSQTTWFSLPQKSAVHGSLRFDGIGNTVPQNRNTHEHVGYVLGTVTEKLCNTEAKFSVIGVSDGAMQAVEWLDKIENWKTLGPRMEALALLAPYYDSSLLTNMEFVEWLKKRGRAYLKSAEEEGAPVYGVSSKKNRYGCPAFSLGERHYSELMLPKGYKTVVDWFWEVVGTGEEYENPLIFVPDEEEAKEAWTDAETEDEKTEKGEEPPASQQEGGGEDRGDGHVDVDGTHNPVVHEEHAANENDGRVQEIDHGLEDGHVSDEHVPGSGQVSEKGDTDPRRSHTLHRSPDDDSNPESRTSDSGFISDDRETTEDGANGAKIKRGVTPGNGQISNEGCMTDDDHTGCVGGGGDGVDDDVQIGRRQEEEEQEEEKKKEEEEEEEEGEGGYKICIPRSGHRDVDDGQSLRLKNGDGPEDGADAKE